MKAAVRGCGCTTGATFEPLAGPLGSFFAFDSGFRGGVFVGADALAGDLDADGTPDLAISSGPGMASAVKVLSGATGDVLLTLSPFGSFEGGVRTALAYVDDDANADVVVGSGPGRTDTVRVFSGLTGEQLDDPIGEYAPFGDATGGVTVAASNDPPVITVAWVSDASEPSTGGSVRFTRDSTATDPMCVSFTLTGTATNGTDYTMIASPQGFPTGQYTFDMAISPIDDASVEGTETVVVTVQAGGGYTVGSPSTATLNIADDDGGGSPPPPPPDRLHRRLGLV